MKLFLKVLFTFSILFVGMAMSTNPTVTDNPMPTTEAKSLSADIVWAMTQSGKQEITDLSNFTVTAGKIYRLTFFGVFKNNQTYNQGFVAEWTLADGAAGNFAGMAFGQHWETNWLGEMWSTNNSTGYQQIQTDKTSDTTSKHSIQMTTAFTCTSSGEVDLYFGGRNSFGATLFKGSAVFVEEF